MQETEVLDIVRKMLFVRYTNVIVHTYGIVHMSSLERQNFSIYSGLAVEAPPLSEELLSINSY